MCEYQDHTLKKYYEKENLKLNTYLILQVFNFAILWFRNFSWVQNFAKMFKNHDHEI